MNSDIESASPLLRCSECGALKGFGSFDMSVAPGTRHHALLNSNEPPDESELTFFRSVVLKIESSLTSLDDEIANLREKLGWLEEERTSLFSYRTRNNTILSALRRIPPELLREIFSWTLPPIKDVDKLDMGQTPWLLTQVSSRWRAIALSTPSLWSRIIIDYSQNHSTYSVSLIKAQLGYSRQLKIHFYASQGMDPRAIDMFKLLSQHSSRWEELSLGLTSELVPALGALRDRLPSLRRSWIQWNHPPDQGVASIDCFQTACSLVDIGIFNEFRFVPTLLPVHQLTLIRYEHDCPLDEHMRILKQTPNLVEARISIDFEEHRWPDSLETVDLLRLRRLYISNPVALKYFKAPALEGLALVEGSDSEDLLPPFQSFLDHSSCFLRRICLVSPAAHTTTKLLQCCPSITELLIVHDDAERRDEIDALILALTGVSIAPHLLLIFVGCEDENHLDYMAYLEMLKSRRIAENCALKSAALLVADGPEPESATISGLHALREEGLDLLLLEGMEATDEIDRWDYKTSWN